MERLSVCVPKCKNSSAELTNKKQSNKRVTNFLGSAWLRRPVLYKELWLFCFPIEGWREESVYVRMECLSVVCRVCVWKCKNSSAEQTIKQTRYKFSGQRIAYMYKELWLLLFSNCCLNALSRDWLNSYKVLALRQWRNEPFWSARPPCGCEEWGSKWLKHWHYKQSAVEPTNNKSFVLSALSIVCSK